MTGFLRNHWLLFSLVFFAVWLGLGLAVMRYEKHQLSLALIDNSDWHAAVMQEIATGEGVKVTRYKDGVTAGLRQAYEDKMQVIVVVYTLICQDRHLEILKTLSQTSQVFVIAGDWRHRDLGYTNCPDYRPYMTVVSGVLPNGEKPTWLLHNADLWITCQLDPCSTSEAVMRAGARAARGN